MASDFLITSERFGYRFHKAYWGKGYATECTRRLLEYGFTELQLNKVVAVSNPENIASHRVLLKAGLERNGNGFYYDHDLFFFELEKRKWEELNGK
ncbi:MAG: ribosomal-protein-alanine N-acetyltransferase [Limisphaerales bacterium]|jgi:ribosomal-protein-alanine N-acetyltransferase